MNTLVDHVYVLNLEKDLYKYNILKKKLDEKNIVHERFVGVDGYNGDISSKEKVRAFKKLVNEYEEPEIWDRVVYRGGEILANNSGAYRSRGAVGCLISHRNLIQDAIDNKYKKILDSLKSHGIEPGHQQSTNGVHNTNGQRPDDPIPFPNNPEVPQQQMPQQKLQMEQVMNLLQVLLSTKL